MNPQDLHNPRNGNPLEPTQRPTTSRLAIVAFVLSLIPCCPLVSILGAMLGITALRRISASNGMLRGKRLAQSAIISGIALGVATLILYGTFGRYVQRTNEQTITREVSDSINAAIAGNIREFERLWTSDAKGALTPEMIQQFGAEAFDRYGAFKRFTIASTATTGVLDQQYDVAGVFVFEKRELTGSAKFNVQAGYGEIWPQFRLKSLLIEDRQDGDLRLPRAAYP